MTDRSPRPAGDDTRTELSPRPSCGERHPLFEDIRCQRLSGHPGAHRASIGEGAGLLEWAAREQKAG